MISAPRDSTAIVSSVPTLLISAENIEPWAWSEKRGGPQRY